MNICVVGWYGTETLGDRSILLGLSKVIDKAFGKSKIYLGSMYPFYSERCLFEDKVFYNTISPDVSIEIFDVRNSSEYKKVIRKSDIIAMGGGPIMDLHELGIIEFGFGFAKRNNVKTALLGCGLGPLLDPQFQKISAHILSLSDLIILRDHISGNSARNLCGEYGGVINAEIQVLHDPAIIPIEDFFDNIAVDATRNTNQLVMNLREFPHAVFRTEGSNCAGEDHLVELLKKLSGYFEIIKLVPMHTFYIGGDDRYYLSKIKQMCKCSNIQVVNKPMSVLDLFKTIFDAGKCIGMRYHSVVFQTLINGNNAILDYTQPDIGKISGFLDMINGKEFYKNKYINIQNQQIDTDRLIEELLNSPAIVINKNIYQETRQQFTDSLKKLF